LAQLADDPTTDLLDYVCNVGIAGWIDLDKTQLEALVSAIKKDALDESLWSSWVFSSMVID
jgi:hypothetical protein